jgi:hypothetical protein
MRIAATATALAALIAAAPAPSAADVPAAVVLETPDGGASTPLWLHRDRASGPSGWSAGTSTSYAVETVAGPTRTLSAEPVWTGRRMSAEAVPDGDAWRILVRWAETALAAPVPAGVLPARPRTVETPGEATVRLACGERVAIPPVPTGSGGTWWPTAVRLACAP